MAAHPEADGKDGVEIVVLDIAKNLTISLSSNYSITSNSCVGLQALDESPAILGLVEDQCGGIGVGLAHFNFDFLPR